MKKGGNDNEVSRRAKDIIYIACKILIASHFEIAAAANAFNVLWSY
jgi:hypothetical protein